MTGITTFLESLAKNTAQLSARISNAAAQLNDRVALMAEVQEATSDLSLAIHHEKTLIQAALKMAKSKQDLEAELAAADDNYRAAFEESYARYSRIFANERAESRARRRDDTQCVGPGPRVAIQLDSLRKHEEPGLAEAVAEKVATLLGQRETFLAQTIEELLDGRLAASFRMKLDDQTSSRNASLIWQEICSRSAGRLN